MSLWRRLPLLVLASPAFAAPLSGSSGASRAASDLCANLVAILPVLAMLLFVATPFLLLCSGLVYLVRRFILKDDNDKATRGAVFVLVLSGILFVLAVLIMAVTLLVLALFLIVAVTLLPALLAAFFGSPASASFCSLA